MKEYTEDNFMIIRTEQLLLNHKYKVESFFEMPTRPEYAQQIVAIIANNGGASSLYLLPPRARDFVYHGFNVDRAIEINCRDLFMTVKGFREDMSPIIKFSKNNYELKMGEY